MVDGGGQVLDLKVSLKGCSLGASSSLALSPCPLPAGGVYHAAGESEPLECVRGGVECCMCSPAAVSSLRSEFQ